MKIVRRNVSLLNSTKVFVATDTKVMWRKTSDARLAFSENPERATTGCVVNARMHRGYLELGGEVHVEIYDSEWSLGVDAMPSVYGIIDLGQKNVRPSAESGRISLDIGKS